MRPEHLDARRSKGCKGVKRAGLLAWRRWPPASLLQALLPETRRTIFSLQWRDRTGFSPASLFSPPQVRQGTRTLLAGKNREQMPPSDCGADVITGRRQK